MAAAAPPPRKLSPAEEVALQQAGQYAGRQDQDILTSANAEQVGLDPERGFVAKGTPTDQPQIPAVPAPPEVLEYRTDPGSGMLLGPSTLQPGDTREKPSPVAPISNLIDAALGQPGRLESTMKKLQPDAPPEQGKPGEIKIPGSTEIKDDGEFKIPGSTEIKKPAIDWTQPIPLSGLIDAALGQPGRTDALMAKLQPDAAQQIQIQGSTEVPEGQTQPPPQTQAATTSPAQEMIDKLVASGMSSDAAQAVLKAQHPELFPAAPPTYPRIARDQPDTHEQIRALVEEHGLTSGQAQAVVAGQIPRSISGNVPPPPVVKVSREPAPSTTTYIAPPLIGGKAPAGSDQPSTQPATGSEQPSVSAQPHKPIDTLQAGKNNAVDPVALYSYLLNKFSHSPLVNYVPPDGDYWKIKHGSAAEWAAFGLAVAKQESDLNTRSWNSHDPGGSAGLFQFGQGQTQFTGGRDQFNPQASADAFVRAVEHYVGNKGSVANMGKTFGSILRRNEAGQYIAGAQKVAAGGSGKDLVSSGGGSGGGKGPSQKEAPSPEISLPSAKDSSPPLGFEGGGGYRGGGSSGGGRGGGGQQNVGTVDLGGFAGGGGRSGGSSDDSQQAQAQQAQPSRQQMQVSAPLPDQDQQNPMVKALVDRGFTPQQAIQFAQSTQTVAPGKGIGPLTVKGPLDVKGPPPAAPSATSQFKLVSPKQLMPHKVPKLGPQGKAPPPAPSAPSAKAPLQLNAPPPAPSAPTQPIRAPLSPIPQRPGTPTQPTAPVSPVTPQQQAPARQPQEAQAPPPPAPPPKDQPKPKAQPQPEPEPTEFTGRPAGSTHGNSNPPGIEALSGKLTDQAKQHTALLSDDDPRVKKQKDGLVKGEHFVEGDPFHEQLLSGLPHGKQGHQRGLLGQAETAIGDKQPMHISYISAPKEAEKFPTRDTRKVQYDESSPEARLMGTTVGQLVGHSLIPLNVGVKLSAKGSEPHQSYIQGISTNVLANNFQHLNDKLSSMGRKTPYKELGAKFANDLEGYFHNLLSGHVGTGSGYAIGTDDLPNSVDREHVPYKLSRREADFIGAVINNDSAFAKHEDAAKIRELARVNGTLVTPEGETNRLRHDIEQHEPGWRKRMLEPSIRTFKAGLVHEVHPSEEHLPQEIRPGKGYQALTKALARTSERGRPDVQIGASLHHSFLDNKKINEIERDFSKDLISEEEARARLKALGEDPDEYKFEKGSGGLVSPYEPDPESISKEEHDQMHSNLRQQWIGGKLDIENYRRKAAEIPLPTRPSKPPAQSKESTDEPESLQSSSVSATPSRTEPEPRRAASMPRPAESEPSRAPSKSAPSPEPLAPKPETLETPEPAPVVKPKPKKAPVAPPQEAPEPSPEPSEPSEEAAPPKKAPAPDEPLPKVKAVKPAAVSPPVAPPGKLPKLVKPKIINPKTGEKEWAGVPEAEKQAYLEEKVRRTMANQIRDKATHELKVQRNEDGSVKYDPNGSPVYEQHDYDIANSPMLKKKALNQIKDADKHEDTIGNLIGPDGKEVIDPETGKPVLKHKHLNQTERRRLSAMHTASAVHTMGDRIFDSYKEAIKNPDIAAGEGWYSRMREKLAGALGEHHELFAQLLGATSAKTPVRTNFINALDAFEQYKEGKFKNHIEKYLEAHGKLQEGEGALTQHMRDLGILKAHEADHESDADAMAHWIKHHEILPKSKIGNKYSANSNAVLKVLAGKWLQEVGAPKTPNFAGNLTGRTLEATIDVWAARHLQRLGYEGHMKGPWRAQSAAEPGVSSIDFAFSQDAMRHAADRITRETGKQMNPDDLQAILWFAEKHHYEDRGWTRGQGAEKSSFDEVADKVFGKDGKPHDRPMDSTQLRAHYAAEAKALQQRKGKIKTARSYLGTPNEQKKLPGYMQKHGLTHEEVHGAEAEDEDEEAA